MPKRKERKLNKQIAAGMLAELATVPLAMFPPAIAELNLFAETMQLTGVAPDRPLNYFPQVDRQNQTGATYSQKTQIVGGKALIQITGMIRPKADVYTKYFGCTACSELVADAEAAANDSNISEIIYLINSPGGLVTGVDEASSAIYDLRSKKPATAIVDGLCASAAYYLGSSVGKLYGGTTSLSGSIGTILTHFDWSKAFEEFGIKVTPIHFGKHKADGSPYRPLDEQSRATLQEMIDGYGKQFVAAVASNRGVSPETVMKSFGQGKVFLSEEATTLGMIDGVATIKSRPTQAENEPTGQLAGATASGFGFGMHDLGQFALGPITFGQQPAGSNPTIQVSGNSKAPSKDNSERVGIEENEKVTARIKAQLFAIGLISAFDAEDNICEAALSAFCFARGVEVPSGEDAEAKTIQILQAGSKPVDISGQVGGSAGGSGGNGNAETETVPAEMSAAEYKERRENIEALAEFVNAGRPQPVISAEDIRTALDSDNELKSIQDSFKSKLTNDPEAQPVRTPITFGPSSEDQFADAFVLHCLGKLSHQNGSYLTSEESAANQKTGLKNEGLMQLAEMSYRITGQRFESVRDEDRAREALKMGSDGTFFSVHASSAPAYNRPGDFGNLLSNLAGKILDRQLELARTTYAMWAAKLSDANDFKPRTITQMGAFTQLDDVMDGENAEQMKFYNELRGYIQVLRKANTAKLTPVMVADDDMDGFANQLMTLANAHELTLDIMCIDKLAGNEALVDGNAIFSSQHSNLVTGGGAPSKAQAKKHRLLHAKMPDISGEETIAGEPEIVLCPIDIHEEALQTYLPFGSLPEVKRPSTDSEINVYRGSVRSIIGTPRLSAYSETAWYTFDNPQIHKVIAYAFMKGYGRGGRRTTWFEPGNECRLFKLEGRFGVSAVGYRGGVKNPGA